MKPSPLYADLKNGLSVTLPDGSVIHPHEVVGAPIKGRKVPSVTQLTKLREGAGMGDFGTLAALAALAGMVA